MNGLQESSCDREQKDLKMCLTILHLRNMAIRLFNKAARSSHTAVETRYLAYLQSTGRSSNIIKDTHPTTVCM